MMFVHCPYSSQPQPSTRDMIQDQHWDWQSLWKWLHYIWCQYKSRGLFRSYCDYNGYSMSSSILSGRLLARDSTSLCLPLGSVIVGPHVARGVQLTRLRSWNVEMCLLSTPLARYLHLSSARVCSVSPGSLLQMNNVGCSPCELGLTLPLFCCR